MPKDITKQSSRLVYATDQGRVKNKAAPATRVESDGIVRIRRETSGRKGSGVTTISGISGNDAELKALASRLKNLCGSGGTVKNGVIEIQGDHRPKIATALTDAGYTVKFAGG